jgi:hypothetical protein
VDPLSKLRAPGGFKVNDSAVDCIGEAGAELTARLRSLRLEQCEPVFRADEIDERVLPSLASEDLIDASLARARAGACFQLRFS